MNKSFVILPDVGCDLSKEIREKFDIDFINGHITFPDGEERSSALEWSIMPKEDFYTLLRKKPSGFTTSPPNVEECKHKFTEYVKKGLGVLVLALSTGISGTYDFMCKAKEEVLKEYPNAEIVIIDTLRFASGYGLMAVYASILREQGKTLKEVAEYLENNKNRFHQMGWLDDLSFVAKKGRITHAKAFFGQLVGIKPLGDFDYNGLTTVIGKAKGEKNAYDIMLKYVEKTIENPNEQIILISNSMRTKQAEEYKKLIEEKFHPKAVYISDLYYFCGSNVGPGLMACYYVGKPISKDLSEEKSLMEEIIKSK